MSEIPTGAYHAARPDDSAIDPEREADHFCRVIRRLNDGELRPALDLEVRERHLTSSCSTAEKAR